MEGMGISVCPFFKNKELEQNDLCLLTCDNIMG